MHADVEAFCVYIAIFLISSVFSLCLAARCQCKYLSDAGLLLLTGFACGGLFLLFVKTDKRDVLGEVEVEETLSRFSSDALFSFLLPPIIFKSGYEMQGKCFWANIDKIVLLAFLGTLVSSLIVGVLLHAVRNSFGLEDLSMSEALAFGALISATDPVTTLSIFEQLGVDPDLFNLVFGESVLNDAVSIVLFRTFISFTHLTGSVTIADMGLAALSCATIFGGSLVLGVLLAYGASLAFRYARKRTHLLMHGHQLEMLLFLITCYAPFLLAELLGLSGIVTILFTGVTTRRYANESLSEESRHHAESIVGVLAYAAESLIFIELGTCAWLPFHVSWQLVVYVTFVCLIARAAHVYPIGAVLNTYYHCKSVDKGFKRSHMNIVWFSGLRGAIAYALSTQFPGKYSSSISSLTMAITLSTIWILGGATEPLLRCQGITESVKQRYSTDLSTISKHSSVEGEAVPLSDSEITQTVGKVHDAEQPKLPEGGVDDAGNTAPEPTLHL